MFTKLQEDIFTSIKATRRYQKGGTSGDVAGGGGGG
jgi:hypothetical protein